MKLEQPPASFVLPSPRQALEAVPVEAPVVHEPVVVEPLVVDEGPRVEIEALAMLSSLASDPDY